MLSLANNKSYSGFVGPYSSITLTAYTQSPRVYRESALRQTHDCSSPDADVYLCDPSDAALISPLPAAENDRLCANESPSFTSNQQSIKDLKLMPILNPSPRTPFEKLFSSSPSCFWAVGCSSISPVFRHMSPSSHSVHEYSQHGGEISSAKRLQSLADYQMSHNQRVTNDGVPVASQVSPFSSSLSSLSATSSTYEPSECSQASPIPLESHRRPSPSRISSVKAGETSLPTRQNESRYTRPRRHAEISRQSCEHNASREVTSTKRKRGQTQFVPTIKKRRIYRGPEPSSDSESESPITSEPPSYPHRTFPLSVQIHPEFLLFYRRFPVSSFREEGADRHLTCKWLSDATYNSPRHELDLYTPRFVKGKGTTKVGLCPCCCESALRGGEGKKLWLSMKFSAFKCTGKQEKTEIIQGKCHKCLKWIAVEGIKDVPTKVKEIYWWKHAATCHQGSIIEGECDIYLEDDFYDALRETDCLGVA
ncbi:uncharacterized protein FIBRA_00456 [Fibroporia radiculosa]|uniref:Transcription regulator Rua1 C-terminal domain-containing protein n=1 Tax=Fibroporia radiculosa TaxID=599839 RepID=J4G093_9APHY|nr:uncharacterized protein FIBRA_00456 [Fibroporia radiculosa]CCL98458.1 predicted protein [Fibroporia radiculosa]